MSSDPCSTQRVGRVMSRREAVVSATAVAAGLFMGAEGALAQAGPGGIRTRAIPHGAEKLPVVGVGTAIAFDVGDSARDRAGCTGVLRALVDGGGTLVDTAPSYGNAESVIGGILTDTGLRQRIFLATKLEHYGDGTEASQLQASLQRLRTDKVDLVQLHNVDDPLTSLKSIRELKERGLCRYTGITTTFPGAYAAAEEILKREKPDFLEVDYAIDNRGAEQRLLPAAADSGTAVLVALPFGRGRLFRAALGRRLPDWAAEFDCHSWAQFFLKFVLGNPSVTAVIPGTDKAVHMTDDLGGGIGQLPNAQELARMAKYIQSLG